MNKGRRDDGLCPRCLVVAVGVAEALCRHAQGHAEACRQCTCRRARARARLPLLHCHGTRWPHLFGDIFDRIPTRFDGCGSAWQSSWVDLHMHDIKYVDPLRFRERANKFFGLVAERRRVLRQMVVAPGGLLRRLACGVFAVYS